MLDIEVDAGLEAFVADGKRVTQMLYNLLSNAIGFSEHGGQIALGCAREGSMIAFTVEDEGVGIPEIISRPYSTASKAARMARAIAVPASGFPS